MLRSLGDIQVIPQKTRLVCVGRVRFAGLTPRHDWLMASFALRRRLDHPRISRHETYAPRWHGHFVPIRSKSDIDDQLRSWLDESYRTVGLQR